MKHLCVYISLALGTMAVQAADPWAEHNESVMAREGISVAGNDRMENVTVLPRILEGKPVRVNIETSGPVNQQTCEKLQGQVRAAYQSWFQNAANLIRAQRREQEFGDILPKLQRGVSMEFACVDSRFQPARADMTVAFKDTLEQVRQECENPRVGGCKEDGYGKYPMRVIVPIDGGDVLSKEQLDNILTHEIGHTLGLADAYREGYKKNASARYRSDPDKTFEDSVMDAGGAFALSADDADGLINIVDAWTVYRAQKKYANGWDKHVSPRIVKGWGGLSRSESTGSSFERYQMGTSQSIYLEQTKKR